MTNSRFRKQVQSLQRWDGRPRPSSGLLTGGDARPTFRRGGFTLIEVMVVTAISLLLVGVSTFIYTNCMRLYKDSQGIMTVYETARLINRDLLEHLSNVVPIPGAWITPRTVQMPGQANATTSHLHPWNIYYYTRGVWYQNVPSLWDGTQINVPFQGPSDSRAYYRDWIHRGQVRVGASGGNRAELNWGLMGNYNWVYAWGYNGGQKGWYLPGFYGKRNGADPNILKDNEVVVGSWGFPRADYRLDANADDLTNHSNIGCWFYSEDRYFNCPYTLALDNPNLLLTSLKFTKRTVNNREETQLTIMKHHVVGFDHSYLGGSGKLVADISYGNMLRAISITPCYMDAGGDIKVMGDSELGCTLAGATVAGGNEVPRCFDVRYTLRNPATLQAFSFVLRAFCRTNPQ